ncbi:PREDICTED: olfactory receptor 14A16-like [Chrysochloris asiatica]|uniref:Olfactory receptor 14A16-like n=1 Tax=Chrysochloris asiatica TaxID=185453 RepID=A0A9B0UD21_CHRAS|nr:PREDICTED: olfactory receptor 14A16-like [Chrysochloris asiatica]
MTNHSVVMEFYLMEFSNTRELRVLHAFVFLIIYLETIMGNLLIIILVILDQSLHTPMYFFLQNLSFLDSCLISITVPNFILNSLSHRSTISMSGCVLQIFLVVHFVGSELFLLSIMSYDRYVAICHPLHYENIMNRGFSGNFSLSFCGSRKLPRFFCDVPSLLKISLLRMPSFQGRSKAFSTCLPHLVVVITFFMTGAIAYLKPVPDSPDLLDFVIVPPSLNPIIYSLRNKEIKVALCKILWKLSHYKNSK